jgi:starvation-inducible DNA-binding protein
MLAEDLKVLLATNFSFYLKTHMFHWNVEGPDFVQYHKFFGKIYENAFAATDRIAEYIRVLGEYTPGSLERFNELSQISDQTRVPRTQLMIEELTTDNNTMLLVLNKCFVNATAEQQEGIANFVAERIDIHGKWGWMLRSVAKEERA